VKTRLAGATKEIFIGDGQPTRLIGERINPSGKRKLSEALKAGQLDLVREEALAQVQAGADILDINVNLFGVDDKKLLSEVVHLVMETVDVPICIDSPHPETIEAGLKACSGKPLINSVTGEKHSLETILPLVKQYGAAVIGLLQDDQSIPTTPDRRLAVAHHVIERAEALGIPREDIVIDALVMAVGADPQSGSVTLETIRRIRAELGVNVVLGASNISFGLPDREVLNNAFVALALGAGATCLIVDVSKVRPAVLAADLALGRDDYARRYIAGYRQRAAR